MFWKCPKMYDIEFEEAMILPEKSVVRPHLSNEESETHDHLTSQPTIQLIQHNS